MYWDGMKNKLLRIKEELVSFSKEDKLFLLFAMLCSFFITMEASIVKAVSNSIFISTYGVKLLPFVWLCIVPFNFFLVHYYNKFIPIIGPMKMQCISMVLALLVSLSGAFLLDVIRPFAFGLYMWKDVYILLMFQQLWSVIHSTIDMKRAKYLYGIIFGMGGLGSVAGSFVPGFFAVVFGSAHLLFATIPIYFALGLCYFLMMRARDLHPQIKPIEFSSKKSNFRRGVNLIYHSPYLRYILLLVMLMQIVSTLLDFNFNYALEKTILEKDLRTQFLGRLFGIINTTNIAVQFFGSFALVQLLGLKRSHGLIPMILLLTVSSATVAPLFSIIAFAFASAKCLDYSLFGVLREMLYVPLKVDEKFKAKSVIDVFAYRTSKAFASLMIVFVQFCLPINPTLIVFITILALCVVWGASVKKMFYHREELISAENQ